MEILYEDNECIIVNKPHGLLVHRTSIASDATEFLLQIVRDLVGNPVFLVHRLDRKTSGVILLSKKRELVSYFQDQFLSKTVSKKYISIVRGFVEPSGCIDYILTNDRNKEQEAITRYKRVQQFEVPFQIGKFPTTRYSLIEVTPETGRFHQIRKHMAHIFHPIIGDRPHGCNKQNRFWKHELGIDTMFLHAEELGFVNYQGEHTIIVAKKSDNFTRALTILKTKNILS